MPFNKQHQQRKVGAVKKASGIQDTLAINEALADNGNDAKKVCENFGCVVREHGGARPNYELRSQASIEAHEEKMQAIQKKLQVWSNQASKDKLEEELLNEARAFNQRRNQHNKFDLHYLTVNVAVRYTREIIEEARKKGEKSVSLITGAGNNSINGISNTKNAIMWDVRLNMANCRVTEEPCNKAPQRRLLRQFFKALIVQSMGPTIFLVFPAAPVLLTPVLSPLLDIKVSWQTGWMFTLIGLYPPFDSIAFMIIVSEYKHVIRKQLKLLIGDKTPVASIMYSKSSRTL